MRHGEEVPVVSDSSRAAQRRALAMLTLALGVGAAWMLRSLLAPLVAGAWFAALLAPAMARVSGRLGPRPRLAAAATALLVLATLAPVALLVMPLTGLVGEAFAVLARHAGPGGVGRWLGAVSGSAPGGATTVPLERLASAARSVGPSAAALASRAVSSVAHGAVQLFALVGAAYTFSSRGREIYAVVRAGSPLAPAHFDRLAREALTVARGLLVGGLLTALAQGVVAWAVYLAVGAPNPAGLAALTGIASAIPVAGTALVWVPICAVLAGAGRTRDAVVLAVCGVVLIGSIDNVLRPFLARLGAREIHPLVMFLGVVGGLVALGPWGLMAGPLVLVLFVSAYRLHAEEASTTGPR